MIHQPSGGALGINDRYWNQCAWNPKIREQQIKSGRTYRSATEKIARDVERDYWLDAQEAKEYGLIDEVRKPSSIANRLHNYKVLKHVLWTFLCQKMTLSHTARFVGKAKPEVKS